MYWTPTRIPRLLLGRVSSRDGDGTTKIIADQLHFTLDLRSLVQPQPTDSLGHGHQGQCFRYTVSHVELCESVVREITPHLRKSAEIHNGSFDPPPKAVRYSDFQMPITQNPWIRG